MTPVYRALRLLLRRLLPPLPLLLFSLPLLLLSTSSTPTSASSAFTSTSTSTSNILLPLLLPLLRLLPFPLLLLLLLLLLHRVAAGLRGPWPVALCPPPPPPSLRWRGPCPAPLFGLCPAWTTPLPRRCLPISAAPSSPLLPVLLPLPALFPLNVPPRVFRVGDALLSSVPISGPPAITSTSASSSTISTFSTSSATTNHYFPAYCYSFF